MDSTERSGFRSVDNALRTRHLGDVLTGLIVDGYVPTKDDATNLREDAWSLALDQRALGPRQLIVAFADADGSFRGLAYTDRTDPPDAAFKACVDFLGAGAAAAIAYCDEPVAHGEPPDGFMLRFARMREVAANRGVRLIDWIACDDELFRSSSLSLGGNTAWWDVA